MKKLFHLLRKDVLLMWRSKVWTAFEIVLPLVLIVGCAALVKMAASVSDKKEKNETTPVLVPFNDIRFFLHCPHPVRVDPYFGHALVTWDNRTVVTGEIDNWNFVEEESRFDSCTGKATVAWNIEHDLSSTIILPLVGKNATKTYNFVSYNYYINKILFGLNFRKDQHTHEILKINRSLKSVPVPKFDNRLYTLPVPTGVSMTAALLQIFTMIYGISIIMPVISLTRNLLVEKESVKPYLSTIGLPTWLFYVEHFTFGVLKTTILITFLSLVWLACLNGFPVVTIFGIMVYTMNSMSFAVFFSTIFPNAKRAVEGMVLIWMGCVLLSMQFEGAYGMTWIVSLNPNHAFKNFIVAVGSMDGSIFYTKSTKIQCAAVYIAIMVFNTVWMLIASIFMEKLLSALSHLIFKKLWGYLGNRGQRKTGASSKNVQMGLESTILNCAEKMEGRESVTADIELSNLVKVYSNGEKAVNGLSLRAIRGQVSILLGHNGCGKSTTFGMITGVHKPTEGQVMIGGIDANKNRGEARKLIGYCPQYNPIYEKLTVWEHLRLVNALKGGSSANFQAEAESLLAQIELTDKKKTLAKNLSGGMKRKLCVCMAMIGGSQVILLDEPTAGMDPAARLDVQKMLALVKQERTILLTTHYMDEAEKLGDWVFVMSHGKMAASGSIHYLKQKYGGGMLLTMVFKDSSNNKKTYEAAHAVCSKICPTAKVKDERGQMMEMSIAEFEKPRLPILPKALEAITEKHYQSADLQALGPVLPRAKEFELVTIGISMSSLEQVFIKIGDECDDVISGRTTVNKKLERQKKFEELIVAKQVPAKTGFSKTLQTVTALLQKRAYYLYRNPLQILLQIIFPLATLWLMAKTFNDMKSDPKIANLMEVEDLDLSTYPHSTVVVQQANPKDMRLLDYLTSFENLMVIEEKYSESLKDIVEKYVGGLTPLGFVVQVNHRMETTVYYNKMIPKGPLEREAAVLVNLLSTAMYLRNVYVHELPHITSRAQWMMSAEMAGSVKITDILAMMILFTLVIAGVIIQSTVYLIEERICKFTHQQLLTGLSPTTYWGVVFLWDFLLYTAITLYTLIFILAFGVFSGHVHEVVLLFYCLLFYIAPAVYLISNLINTPTKGSFLIYIFCLVPMFTFLITFSILMGSQKMEGAKTAGYVFRVINPTIAFALGVVKVAAVTYGGGLTAIFESFEGLWEFNGILVELLFLLLFATILLVGLCMTTNKSIRRSCFTMSHKKSQPMEKRQYKGFESCKAVKEEEALISKLNENDNKILVVNGLIKDFGKFRAVNGLSISVGHEECFGMLGANGAGKTTTFDIITGLTMPTGGNVTIEGRNITKTIHIGYCPQFDAMLQQISCRQTLQIMTKLQGYPNVEEVIETVLECVGMKEHGNKLVKNCSGGQKRKISVGIALISRANCIILDEPTAGIDPRARREIWDIIHEMRAQAKYSIVLTSHSMEECEALCTRIGILRKGEMIALGTSQSLKSQYGNTYTMTLVLVKLEDREEVCKKVETSMPSAILKTPSSSVTTTIVWELPKKASDKWSVKYSEVESLAKTLKVKDYMLVQSSLEDTFIRLITTD